MLKSISAFAACLVVASPALAQATDPGQTVTQNAQKAKPKLICESEQETGSRLGGKRVCHTAEEWSQIRAQAREQLEKAQQQNMALPSSG